MGKWDQFWSDKPSASRRRITPDELAPIYGSGYSATEAGDKSPAGVWWEQTRQMSGGLDAGSKILWTSLSDQDQQIIENYYNDKVLKPAMDRWMEEAKHPGDGFGTGFGSSVDNPFWAKIAKADPRTGKAFGYVSEADQQIYDDSDQWVITDPNSVASTLGTYGMLSVLGVGIGGRANNDPLMGPATTQLGVMRLIDKNMPWRYGIDDAYIDDMEQRNKVMQAQRRATHKSHNAMEEGVVAGLIGGMVGLGAAGAVGGSGISAGVASGAAGGAVSSAITGNNVLRGAVTGGVMGGFGAAVGEYAKQFDGMAGSAVKAGGKVVSGLLAGKDPKQALISGAGGFVNSEAGGGLPGQIAGTVTSGLLNQAFANKPSSSASQPQDITQSLTTETEPPASGSSGFGFGAAVAGFSPIQKGGIDWFDSSRYWKG